MIDDAELLRRYVKSRSETDFTALVERHLNLVYQAAFRRTHGRSDLAQDVAQRVFTTLAHEAPKLLSHLRWLELVICEGPTRGRQRRSVPTSVLARSMSRDTSRQAANNDARKVRWFGVRHMQKLRALPVARICDKRRGCSETAPLRGRRR